MRPRTKPHLSTRLEACGPVICPPSAVAPGKIREQFQNPAAPLHLEVGCGKGQFICALASRNPNVNFVALEREINVVVSALERAMQMGLSNLRFMIGDGKELLQFFAPGEISVIYLNFCDPWPKKRHFKRRLTGRGWLETYKTLLCQDGEVRFKTDCEPLYRFSCKEFSLALPSYFETENLYRSQMAAENVMTEYEQRFVALGRPIYSIHARTPAR